MRKLYCLVAFLAGTGLISSAVAFEGSGGVRGGGEVFGDALNPWFLENTQTVTYCVDVDAAHFHLPFDRIAAIVSEALSDWKSEFKSAAATSQVRIATQNFVREQCQASTRIRFQFGSLSSEQRSHDIPTPTGFIAEAVRTSYDKTNLSGQGFIYVAPDSGPLRPKGLKMADQPWSFQNGILLKRILLHELGHVFGLSHSGNTYALMGQGQPEYIVQKSTIEQMAKESPELLEKSLSQIGVFGFVFPAVKEFCTDQSSVKLGPSFEQDQFLGFTPDLNCHKFVFSTDRIEIYGATASNHPYRLLGQTTASTPLDIFQPMVRVKISKQQRVFTNLSDSAVKTGYIDGPSSVTRRTIKSFYETADGKRSGFVKTVFLPDQLLEMEAVKGDQLLDIFQ